MMWQIAALLIAWTAPDPAMLNIGTIEGLVVNASQGDSPVAEAEVVLQLQIEGEWVAVEQTVADAEGRFRFESLPVTSDLLYLPGANRDGIHYPGRRIELTSRRPNAYLTVSVRDAVVEPSPLVVRQHEIVIRSDVGVLHVVEAMRIDNPTSATFVGKAFAEGAPPVTLRLGIPRDFSHLTFEEEVFGREFMAMDGHVATGIPWTPGARWVRFTYSIPNDQRQRLWQRELALPCENLRVRIQHARPDEIQCNLPLVATNEVDEGIFENVYQSGGATLPAGHQVQAELGKLPLPWISYGRWGALALLVVLIAAVVVVMRRSQRRAPRAEEHPAIEREPNVSAPGSITPEQRKRRQNKRSKAA